MAIRLTEVAGFLNAYFGMERYGDDQGGVYRPSERAVRRLGLALEPWPGIGKWAASERLDALFLHRPWRLPGGELGDIGVLAYHLAFDEQLTTGYNPRLAEALGMSGLYPIAEREGRPLGMVGDVRRQSFAEFSRTCAEVFGGRDEARPGGRDEVTRVAVVGAMTDTLVREAVGMGVGAYVTGQRRRPADLSVSQTGMGVVAVGRRRCEEWGVRALASILRERWAVLECLIPTDGVRAGDGRDL